ncbi:unnamed protein product [Mucor hiemalis]
MCHDRLRITERQANQCQQYNRNLNHKSIVNEAKIKTIPNKSVNHLVTVVADNVEVTPVNEIKEEGGNYIHGCLTWLRDLKSTGDNKRPNENYLDESGSEQHYSLLMAKLDSELLRPPQKEKTQKKSWKRKTIEFMSSWSTYTNVNFDHLLSKVRRVNNKKEKERQYSYVIN